MYYYIKQPGKRISEKNYILTFSMSYNYVISNKYFNNFKFYSMTIVLVKAYIVC